jgi:hypothetical protein
MVAQTPETQAMSPDRLIFIYNADGGIAQGIMDSVHKTLSPSTYPCSLCAITYGMFTMDRRWRAWLKALPIPSVFYHKGDSPYRDFPLPVILIERGGQIETLVSAERLDGLQTVDDLIAQIEARL